MAKYGLFKAGFSKPTGEFDGDAMEMNGEYVQILKQRTVDLGTYDPTHPKGKLVAAIRLEHGQFVKEIE